MFFKNRIEAGQKLSLALKQYKDATETVVVGLPRGGVIVAYEVALALHLPLDIIVPRKLGAPDNPELAIGAIAGDGVVLDQELIACLNVSEQYIQSEMAKEKKEAERRLALFRKGRPPQHWSNRTILLIDDGIATGSTMRASIAALRKMGVKKIVIAVPIAAPDTIEKLKKEVSEVICLCAPSSFMAVGQFYEQFPQISDAEVLQALVKAWK